MGPPPESRFTAGAVTSETVMPPSSEATVSGPSMWLACTGPPPELRLTPPGPDTSEAGVPPSWGETLSGPSMWLACTGPPPESRFAPATPVTAMPPLSLSAVTATPAGTVTVNPTLQPVVAQAGASRVSLRSDTAAVTVGARPGPGEVIASLTVT